MTGRVVPDVFQIDERIAFENWLGRFRKQVYWQGDGASIRWKNGTSTYAPPGATVCKTRRGITAVIFPTAPAGKARS